MASSESLTGQQDALHCCLTLLKDECNPQQYQDAVNTLLKIIRNVVSNPSEDKYKELKTSNKTFAEKVWRFAAAQQFLIATGWAEVDDKVMLIDNQYLPGAVAVLEEVSSETGQTISASGAIRRPAESSGPQSQKERKLDENRRKQIEQMEKEKEERKRIAEMIKADRQETSTRKSRGSKARVRQYGANINRFEDIGVDLNSGGGG